MDSPEGSNVKAPRGVNILGAILSYFLRIALLSAKCIFKKEVTMNTRFAILVFTFLVFLTAHVADAQKGRQFHLPRGK